MADDPNQDEDSNFFQRVASSLLKGMTASDVNKRIKDSVAFFTDDNRAKVTDTGRLNISTMTKGKSNATLLEGGQMFTFSYQAKNADTLDYWDRAPMIIFLDIQKNGNLLGLNLHYLPPPVRAVILGRLMKVIGAKKLRHDTKLKLTYEMVRAMIQYRPLQFCIKSYRPDHIKSKMVRIQPRAWHHAVFFPSDHFVGASKRSVWADAKEFF